VLPEDLWYRAAAAQGYDHTEHTVLPLDVLAATRAGPETRPMHRLPKAGNEPQMVSRQLHSKGNLWEESLPLRMQLDAIEWERLQYLWTNIFGMPAADGGGLGRGGWRGRPRG
jgi:hypothetical protein